MKKLSVLLMFAVLGLLKACTVGSARSLDTRRDLTGLDLAYLQDRATPNRDENQASVDGELRGSPFWFLPGLSLSLESTNALYWGPVAAPGDLPGPVDDSDQPATSALTGYRHYDLKSAGIGLLGFGEKSAIWNAAGELQSWEDNTGIGWGLLLSKKEWGDRDGRTGLQKRVLGGAFGYLEEDGRGYLQILWIPIPVL